MGTGIHDGGRWRSTSWVLYDLANTIYFASLTFLLTPYVLEHHGALTGYSITHFASMLLAALLVPLLGALTDQTLRTRRYLTIATLGCVAAMACFGLDRGHGVLLACFFVANVAYNLALLFYNSLLPSVAPPERAGQISAIGVGTGYAGSILVLLTLLPLDWPTTEKFPFAALLFLVFALPCLLLVRDRRPRRPDDSIAIRQAYRSLTSTLRQLPRNRPLLWFLLANFCFADVLNTAVFFFGELTLSTFSAPALAGSLELLGYSLEGESGLKILLLVCALLLNGLALGFGLSIGRWTDRAPLVVLTCSGLALLGALVGGAVFAGHSPLGYIATLVVLGAFGLTGIWSAGRKVIVLLAPPEQIGQYFGLYGITLKLSVLGVVIYGVVRDRYDAETAMLSQTPQLLLGLLFLSMVRLPKNLPQPPSA